METLLFLLGPALCALTFGGAVGLAWIGGRSTARARTPRQALEGLVRKLRGGSEPASTQTFVFADLAGFTSLTEERGDQHAARVVGRFCRTVRRLLLEYRAHEVKSLGDGIMIRADSAAHAVRLGLRLADAGGRGSFPAVRVGVHTGPAVEHDGDWFGTTVNIAARLSSQARPGEVLASEAVADTAGRDDRLAFEFVDERRLRNFSRTVRLYRAAAREAAPGSTARRSPSRGGAVPSLAGAT